MKIFRRILLISLIIVLIGLSAGFLLPAKIHVERSLLVSAPQKSIFRQVNTMRNWVKWSPWLQPDSLMQVVFSGPESGTGAKFSWKSKDKNIRNGSAAIISSVSPDSVKVIFDFNEMGMTTAIFRFIKEYPNTNVTWSLESNLGKNPVSRWFGLFSDRMIGPDLEKGLFNLDQLMLEAKSLYGYQITDTLVPSRIYISVRDTASPSTISNKLASMYKTSSHFLKLRNLSPAGNPVAVFHKYSNHNFDMEAAIPVSRILAVPKGMNCSELSAQRVVRLKYFGSYTSISNAYKAIYAYINDNDLEVIGPVWEEYITNPNTMADSAKRQTDIYLPVK